MRDTKTKVEKIPSELKNLDQWVVYNGEKVPYNPKHPKRRAKPNDLRTCSDFDTALQVSQKNGFEGIGFVISSEDPYVFIDIDHCRNPSSGEFDPDVEDLISAFGSYAEISPSGTGVHILTKGEKPGIQGQGDKNGGFEIYDNSRYFTVTGQHIAVSPLAIEECQEEIDSFYARFIRKVGPSKSAQQNGKGSKAQCDSSNVDYPPADYQMVRDGCAFIAHCEDDAAILSEPEWWAAATNVTKCVNGAKVFHQISTPYSKYTPKETDQKIRHAEGKGPHTCRYIHDSVNNDHCPSCALFGVVTSPVNIGTPSRNRTGLIDSSKRDFPDPIWIGVPQTPEILPQHFPGPIADYIEAVSVFTQTPYAVAGCLVLGALSTVCQKKYIVNVRDGYSEPLNTFQAVALAPGERKTAVFTLVFNPIHRWEAGQAKKLKPKIDDAESLRKTMEAQISGLRREIAKPKTKANDVGAYRKKIRDLEKKLPKIPVVPKKLCDDITPEELASVMNMNGEHISVVSDEGGIFETMAGRYNSGVPNIDLYLKGHATSPYRYDRKSSAPISMESPTLTMSLAVQPDVFWALSSKPGMRGRGLIARFIFYCPTSRLGHRSIEPPEIPADVSAGYAKLITTILGRRYISDPTTRKIVPYTIGLSTDAYDRWVEFSADNEIKLKRFGQFAKMTDWAGKLPGAVIRIAGLFHVAEHASGTPESHEIDTATIDKAIALMDVASEHTRAVLDLMGQNEDLEIAKKIWAWVEKKSPRSFTWHQFQQSFKNRTYWPQIHLGLDALVDRDYLVPVTSDSRTTGFQVNPKALP